MTNTASIQIATLAGDTCVTLQQGEPVYAAARQALQHGHEVTLDFKGVSLCASPFLNGAVGRLLNDFAPDLLQARLHIENASPVTLRLMRRVIDNAKQYYHDPAARAALDAILNEEAERPDDARRR